MCDTLFFPLIIDDGKAGRLAAGASRSGDGHEFHARVLIRLVEIELAGHHLAVEFDTLRHVDGAATTDGNDGVTSLCVEQFHAFSNLLIERVGGELLEDNGIAEYVVHHVFDA